MVSWWLLIVVYVGGAASLLAYGLMRARRPNRRLRSYCAFCGEACESVGLPGSAAARAAARAHIYTCRSHPLGIALDKMLTCEAALRLCLDAFAKHEEWCGFNRDAPGNGIVNRAPAAASAALAAPGDVAPIVRLWHDHAAWSQATFGADDKRGPVGPLKHLRKEAKEAAEAPDDPEEKADCFLLILDAARRSGMSLGDLVTAAQAKLEKNKLREWPAPTDDEPVEHVR